MSTLRVDKITPYLSSSVTIEGSVIQANAATTGSNTFVGDQIIQGTLTASIQEGFALVGGVGDVSTLVATSSFGGALPSGVVSGSAQISSLGFATTGSNSFVGNQIITGSVTISGSAVDDLTVIGNIKATGSALIQSTNGITSQYLSPDFGGSIGVVTIANSTEIGMAIDGATWTTNWGNGPILYVNNTPGDTYEGVFGFQNKTTYTDGRITALKPLDVIGNTTITGSVTISGSATNDLVLIGNMRVTGSVAGINNTITQEQILIDSASVQALINGANIVTTGLNGTQVQQITAENQEGTIGLFVDANGGYIRDYDPNASNYSNAIKLQSYSNYGSGQVQVLRPLQVTGSVSVSDVLQLAQKDPLPGGAVGQLAVSGSNLYYHNGSTWTQIN